MSYGTPLSRLTALFHSASDKRSDIRFELCAHWCFNFRLALSLGRSRGLPESEAESE